MSGVSSQTLAKVRSMVGRFLDESCTIEKMGNSESEQGVPMPEYEVVATGVSCRIIRAGSSMSSSNTVKGGRESLVDKHRCILPYGTTIAADYRIVMSDGRRYEVVDVVDDLTDKAFVQVIINRLRVKNG